MIGIQHDNVFSCVHQLAISFKELKPRLETAEDLLYWVVTSGMLKIFEDEYEMNEQDKINVKKIKQITGF